MCRQKKWKKIAFVRVFIQVVVQLAKVDYYPPIAFFFGTHCKDDAASA